jgi:glutamyl-tRNA synthetase
MKNSLTLPEDEVKERLASGEPYVIRVKIPRKEEVRLNDMIRGWVLVHSNSLDDKVLMKSDGMPTYHLANIVDDHLMEITHVIRGEEWLPSAPLHVLLYKYFGWEDTMPQFAHLPLLLKPDGNGKLSKRDAEKHGFPIFPLDWSDPNTGDTVAGFREAGYLPDAFLNFLSFLGWNPGDHRELFTLEELVEAFSVERIGKSGTKFDINKAKWFNEQYLRAKTDEELAAYLIADVEKEGLTIDLAKATQISHVIKERATFPADIWKEGRFMLIAPSEFDQEIATKRWNSDADTVLKTYMEKLSSFSDEFTPEIAKSILEAASEENGIKLGKIMQAIRLAVTGVGAGPELMPVFNIIGKEELIKRISFALDTLKVNP